MNHSLPLENGDALEALYDSLNLILKNMQICEDFNIMDDIWIFFDNKRTTHTLDFNFFNDPLFVEYQKIELIYNDQVLNISLSLYIKLLFLHLSKLIKSEGYYSYRFDVLKMFFTFLAQSKLRMLDEVKLKDFYSIILTHDLSKYEFIKRYKAPSYTVRIWLFNELHLNKLAARFKSKAFIDSRLIGKTASLRNSVCKTILGMSYQDYIDGESFNFLGLEIGKYYIDHCSRIFDEHSLYVTAIRKTFENFDVNSDSMRKDYRRFVTHIIAHTLMGNDRSKMNTRHYSNKTIDSWIEYAKSNFLMYYNEYFTLFNAGKTSLINEILAQVMIPDRFDNQEFIRSLMLCIVNGNISKLKSIESQVEEYKSLLKASGTSLKISTQDFILLISDTLQRDKLEAIDVLKICRHHSERLKVLSPVSSSSGAELLNFLIGTAESAGVTLFLALTGWRSSEYGFPLSSIKISLNIEPKDNAYFPFRFHVKWMVLKTSGKTKLDREITSSSYLIAKQLYHLNVSDDNGPCLYNLLHKNQTSAAHASQTKLPPRVIKAWLKFPFEYELFKDLDKKNESQALKDLSKSELSSLKEIRNELIELSSLSYFLHDRKGGFDTTGKKLKGYQKGELSQSESKVIEKNLSESSLEKLKCETEFTHATVNAIVSEIRNKTVHPTPHAFRHMWAEAVLLRYRGDVGKFIRANFKHMDERFFAAYLRNKETKMIRDIAKRIVINKIVRQQILAIKDNDSSYAGGFNRFLTKAVNLTHVLTYEEYLKQAETIAEQRIVDIKTNAWATCMLRIGTFNTAKCSIDGVPQRFNASPKLCLGCTNANIAEGNFNGIVVYTQQEVKALRNPELPYFIKRDYIQTVQHALKRVKELNEKKGKAQYLKFIEHLEESIQMAEKSKKEADDG